MREKQDDIKAVRDRLLGAAKIGSSRHSGSKAGILSLNREDLPIFILIACLLFIALSFIIEQK